MAKYKCFLCGFIYDEEVEKVKWKDLPEDWKCPKCYSPKSSFEKMQEVKKEEIKTEKLKEDSFDYLEEYKNKEETFEKNIQEIHSIAIHAKSIIEPMETKEKVVSWDDILILGAQLGTFPLEEKAFVSTKTIIGKKAKQPMELENPIYISHMSFGALSKEAKIALSKGSNIAKTAMCSGEGGILLEEKQNAYKYVFEYVPNLYSVTDENLQSSDAIEIKIGQGTKPGMGGHLPAEKVTKEIARIREKEEGKDIISPSKFANITNKEELKQIVEELRKRSKGRPIGIKIAAGNIEEDLEIIKFADPDFITIDGRGGATGASPKFIKDATSIPTIYALYRAKKYIVEHNWDVDLIITGGLRVSRDFIKAFAMGADAVAIASSALMALGCERYRICENGGCPLGIATQDEELRKRLNIDKSSKRVANFLNTSLEELKTFARITGKNDIHKVSQKDLVTTNMEISNYTNIKHV